MGKLSKVSCALAVASLTSATLFAPVVGAHPVTAVSSVSLVSFASATYRKHGEGGDEESGGHFFFPIPRPPQTLSVQQVPAIFPTTISMTVPTTSNATCPVGVLVGGGYTIAGASAPMPSVLTSQATGGNTWTVTVSSGGAGQLVAFAECVLLS